jgi:hypothetical protein
VWNNMPDDLGGAAMTVQNSCVEGGYPGPGNIDQDPLLFDIDGPDNLPGNADDNLRLSIGSPCIDSGDLSSLPADHCDLNANAVTSEWLPVDRDGLLRIFGPGVDMGGYEHGSLAVPDGDVNCDGVVTPDDAALLVQGLLEPSSAPGCSPLRADVNGDYFVDGRDVAAFVTILLP